MPAAAPSNPPTPAVAHRTSASRATRLRRGQWALGLAVTVALMLVQATGLTARTIELFSLDLRALWFGASAPPSSSSVAVIAIDQQALDTVGRWPWPRERLAQVIDELRIAGARVIALDLLLDDASLPRVERDETAPAGIRAVDDDQLLADAIARHGAVITAVSFPFDWIGQAPDELQPTLGRVTTAQLFKAVRERPELAELPFEDTLNALRPLLPADERDTARGAAINDLRLKLAVVRSLTRQASRSAVLAPAHPAQWPTSKEPRAPVSNIALASARLASVTFDSYDSFDGKVRRIPLWVRSEGKLWPTLGLAAVAQFRSVHASGFNVDPSRTTITAHDGTTSTLNTRPERFRGRGEDGRRYSKALDGLFYVPWPVAMPDWQAQFEPPDVTRKRLGNADGAPAPAFESTAAAAETVAAGAVLDPVLSGERVRSNIAELDKAVDMALKAGLAGADDYAERSAAMLAHPVGAPEWSKIYAEQARAWASVLDNMTFQIDGVEGIDLATLPDIEQRKITLARSLADGMPALIKQVESGLTEIIDRRKTIREKVSGRICFVGWTATGSLADFVGTSVHPRTPGVLVHAAVANALLTGLARDPGPGWLDALALLAMGILGTWAGVRLGVLTGPLALAAAVVGWFLITGAVFWDAKQTIVAFSAPALASIAGWATVMLHRLLIEQRARRRTEERFRSYVSPAVVDILVNNPQLNSMAPQKRELTVMFTDLAGFTTTAERLGSERTAQLLAAYLRTMTEILQSTGATLDKYLGDGIMAFWGAPIADPNHAANACRAAVLMQRAVTELNAKGEFADAGQLEMRVGIASGELMVGDFGNPPRNSSYTVLGDTANLAARLEAANKFFGSKILASSRVVQLAAVPPVPGTAWRPIGRIVVKGKQQHEAIAELIDSHDQGDAAARIAATDAMVAAYVSGRFEECRARADALAREFSDVKLANLYRLAVDRVTSGGRKDSLAGFEGTIELLEKG